MTKWAYGLRTWDKDGRSYGGFKWDLTPGARTIAPDWQPTNVCGAGLHCNPYGIGDWSLMASLDEVVTQKKIFGLVRYDAEEAIDLDGKVKAPWMEVVITTANTSLGDVLSHIAKLRIDYYKTTLPFRVQTTTTTGNQAPAATTGEYAPAATTGYAAPAATTGYAAPAATTGNRAPATTTGEYAPATTTGNRAPAATTGNRAPAATTGYAAPAATTGNRAPAATTGEYAPATTTGEYAPATTTGNRAPATTTGNRAPAATTGYAAPAATTGAHSPAAALGEGGRAKASKTGAIVLASYGWKNNKYGLLHVFAGMVGRSYRGVKIKPDTFYTLNTSGKLEECA